MYKQNPHWHTIDTNPPGIILDVAHIFARNITTSCAFRVHVRNSGKITQLNAGNSMENSWREQAIQQFQTAGTRARAIIGLWKVGWGGVGWRLRNKCWSINPTKYRGEVQCNVWVYQLSPDGTFMRAKTMKHCRLCQHMDYSLSVCVCAKTQIDTLIAPFSAILCTNTRVNQSPPPKMRSLFLAKSAQNYRAHPRRICVRATCAPSSLYLTIRRSSLNGSKLISFERTKESESISRHPNRPNHPHSESIWARERSCTRSHIQTHESLGLISFYRVSSFFLGSG